ncbi:36.4 kDa proline-rich protein [Platanthera zijinensis]|uniref:36.4 kDa proline-rich protein n=1 Tax=Platanthera zijinensis TaxID=2320716 RepID=A0AAP0BKT3_9ASPA
MTKHFLTATTATTATAAATAATALLLLTLSTTLLPALACPTCPNFSPPPPPPKPKTKPPPPAVPCPPPPQKPKSPTPPAPQKPKPPTPPAPQKPAQCPINVLKLDACVDVLNGLLHVVLGRSSAKEACCPVLTGLAGTDAGLCLCTAIRAHFLDVNLLLPIALDVLVDCGKRLPANYTCPSPIK